MADFINLVMLVCAAVGSMAFGVLAAYWLFRAFFALMRPQQSAVVAVRVRPETASVL